MQRIIIFFIPTADVQLVDLHDPKRNFIHKLIGDPDRIALRIECAAIENRIVVDRRDVTGLDLIHHDHAAVAQSLFLQRKMIPSGKHPALRKHLRDRLAAIGIKLQLQPIAGIFLVALEELVFFHEIQDIGQVSALRIGRIREFVEAFLTARVVPLYFFAHLPAPVEQQPKPEQPDQDDRNDGRDDRHQSSDCRNARRVDDIRDKARQIDQHCRTDGHDRTDLFDTVSQSLRYDLARLGAALLELPP